MMQMISHVAMCVLYTHCEMNCHLHYAICNRDHRHCRLARHSGFCNQFDKVNDIDDDNIDDGNDMLMTMTTMLAMVMTTMLAMVMMTMMVLMAILTIMVSFTFSTMWLLLSCSLRMMYLHGGQTTGNSHLNLETFS